MLVFICIDLTALIVLCVYMCVCVRAHVCACVHCVCVCVHVHKCVCACVAMDVHVLYYMDGCFDGGLQVQNNKQLLSLQKHKVGSGLDDFRPPEVRILFSAQLCMYLRGNGALTSLCVSDWGNGGWQGDSLVYYRGG